MKKNLNLFLILIICLLVLAFFFFIPISSEAPIQVPQTATSSTPTIDQNFSAKISNEFLNYQIIQQSNTGASVPTDKFELIDSKTNSVIYTAEAGNSIFLSSVSQLPYIILISSCANCDAPPQGSIILNVQNGKSIKLPFEDVVAIDFSNRNFHLQKYEYLEQSCAPEEPLCSGAKSFISARVLPFDSLK